jgi:putative pyruvate formate lyase activating enzyme
MIVRHLVLPNHTDNSKACLRELLKIDKGFYISLMSQYFVTPNASKYPLLSRRVSETEYRAVLDYFFDIGLKNGFMQGLDSASEDYVPDFDISELQKMLKSAKIVKNP